MRRILRTSVNPDIHQLYTITSPKNIVVDDIERAATGITKQYQLKNATKKILEKENLAQIWSNFVDLKEQCSIIIRITDSCYKKSIELWHGVVC